MKLTDIAVHEKNNLNLTAALFLWKSCRYPTERSQFDHSISLDAVAKRNIPAPAWDATLVVQEVASHHTSRSIRLIVCLLLCYKELYAGFIYKIYLKN